MNTLVKYHFAVLLVRHSWVSIIISFFFFTGLMACIWWSVRGEGGSSGDHQLGISIYLRSTHRQNICIHTLKIHTRTRVHTQTHTQAAMRAQTQTMQNMHSAYTFPCILFRIKGVHQPVVEAIKTQFNPEEKLKDLWFPKVSNSVTFAYITWKARIKKQEAMNDTMLPCLHGFRYSFSFELY